MALLTGQGHGSLTGFENQCSHLDRFVELAIPDSAKKLQQPMVVLCRLWNSLALKFTSFVKEVRAIYMYMYMYMYSI